MDVTITLHTYDDYGNQLTSTVTRTGATGPVTLTTTNVYDAAGNLTSATDAKGQTTTYAYDALNRVTQIAYAGGVTHSYQYDQGSYGKGRLTQVTDPSGTTAYGYDPKGRLTREARTLNGVVYTTAYAYDGARRLTGVTYPGGRQLTYTLDALGRVSQIASTKDGTTQTVVANVAYRPFGPVAGYTYGNGQAAARGYDQDGRIASYTLADAADARWQVSVGGGTGPAWAHSGRELFYINRERNMVAVEVPPGPNFRTGAARELFPLGRLADTPFHRGYDVTPDDRGFIMLEAGEVASTAGDTYLNVTLNWLEEVRAAMGKK